MFIFRIFIVAFCAFALGLAVAEGNVFFIVVDALCVLMNSLVLYFNHN